MSKNSVYTKEELELLDMDILITRGMLYAYGIIPLEELYILVKKYNKELKRNKLIKIIKNNEKISNDFEIKDIKTGAGLYECVVYKKIEKSFLEDADIIFMIKRKKLKKEQLLTYAKYGMNIKDKNIESLIVMLKEFLDDNDFEIIMTRVFENLNYDIHLDKTEILLFDKLLKNKKEKITGKKYVEIRNTIHNVLQNCASWRAAGYDVTKAVKMLEEIEMEHFFEEFEEQFDEDDYYIDNNIYNFNEDELPF